MKLAKIGFAALALALSACAGAPASLYGPPPDADQPMRASRPEFPELSAREIVERATDAAGGETWRRPGTLLLEGYAVFYGPGGEALVNERHTMWRVYPEWKPDGHAADGKVRIESWRRGERVTYLAFDGQTTYGPNGALPPSEADRQWAENFGFGVIRFALDPGYSLTRLPDDLVDAVPAHIIEVTDPAGGKTQFAIATETYNVLRVGFATPRGWHERIYSEFYRIPGVSWIQPGRIRLFYNGVKQNELVWRSFTLNAEMPDSLFGPP
jgi:hypothetical protein